MDTKTGTLTDFLLARISEDELVAMSPAVMQTGISFGYSVDPIAPILNVAAGRVLAECEAKRRIVELQPATVCNPGGADHYPYQPSDWGDFDTPSGGCVPCDVPAGDPNSLVLKLLALPYADHEDFRDEWRL